MTWALGIVVPIIAFFFEIYPRLANRKFGVDVWTHLLYLKEYHKEGKVPGYISDGFLVPGEYDYPPAFISIMSRFPLSLVEKYEFVFSPFFDAIHMYLMFGVVYMMTGNIMYAIVTQCIYMLTPIIVLENSSATPRSLGYTLFTIVFLLLFLYTQTASLIYAFCAVIAGVFIFLSHRFTTQGFLFFSVFFSIIYREPVFVFVFVFSFIGAVVVSNGLYLRVLRGHLGNLRFWKEVIHYRFAHQIRGNASTKSSQTDIVFELYKRFVQFPPFVLAITNPWVISGFILGGLSQSAPPVHTYFLWWLGFSYVLANVTLIVKRLRFLGEGQRYLELSAFPAAYLSTFLFFAIAPSFAGIYAIYATVAVLALVTILVIQRKAIISDTLRTLTKPLQQMYSYLSGLKNKPKLLCIPHQITTNTIYHTGCPVYVNAGYRNILQISDVYPYIKEPIEQVMKRNGLTMILLNTQYASVDELKLGRYRVKKQYDPYVLLQPY